MPQVKINSKTMDMKSMPLSFQEEVKKLQILDAIRSGVATLQFTSLQRFMSQEEDFKEAVEDFKEDQVLKKVEVKYSSFYDSTPSQAKWYYVNYLTFLFFRRLPKMKMEGFDIKGLRADLVEMIMNFEQWCPRRGSHSHRPPMLLTVGRNSISFTWKSSTINFDF
jgi:hypothetical protein